jgi:hypothetical protein
MYSTHLYCQRVSYNTCLLTNSERQLHLYLSCFYSKISLAYDKDKDRASYSTYCTSPVSLQTQSESASSLVCLQTRSGSVASPVSWHRPSQGQLNLPRPSSRVSYLLCFLADLVRVSYLTCLLADPASVSCLTSLLADSMSQLPYLSPGRSTKSQLPHLSPGRPSQSQR